MNHLPRTNLRFACLSLATITLLTAKISGQEPQPAETVSRRFSANANVFSFRPGEESATYRDAGGSGTVGPSGTLTLGVAILQRHFEVRIKASLKAQRFLATVTVKPTQGDTHTKAQEIDYDLSDLTPRLLEIARDDDGRIYRLSLIPSISEMPQPIQFKVTDLRLEYWSFPSSPVILNDQDYIGRLSFGSGPLAWCNIPGLAKIEFSLMHLKDASPWGTLENGVINIAHPDGTTLRISDVKNGTNRDLLSGGPYRVWVRWKKPTQSAEEYRASLKRQIASLKARITSGDLSVAPGTIERLEKMSDSDRPGLIGSGIAPIEDDDLEKPRE